MNGRDKSIEWVKTGNGYPCNGEEKLKEWIEKEIEE